MVRKIGYFAANLDIILLYNIRIYKDLLVYIIYNIILLYKFR